MKNEKELRIMELDFPVHWRTVHLSSGEKKNVFYPKIIRMKDKAFQSLINETIVQEVQQLIDQQVGNMPTTVEEMLGTFEIKNNQRAVLSLSLTNYTYHSHAAHGMTYIQSLTFDIQNRKICRLKDLFKKGSNYVERLSTIIHEKIRRRNIPLINEFTTIQPNQDFYLADKTIVIYFQLYDITPYAFGFPMFPINVYDIQDIIEENGPIGRLATNS